MDAVIDYLYKMYGEEVEEVRKDFENLPKVECSTSIQDCLFLYMLVRYYKPKVLLEIGTFVGTTLYSMVKACERNGEPYKIYTIDMEDNVKQNFTESERQNIQFLHGHSDITVGNITEKLDFIFSDADLTIHTANKLKDNVDESTIFATHDFVPPLDKGMTSIRNIFELSCLIKNDIIVPNYDVNWIYYYQAKDSYHDSFTKLYLSNNTVECNYVHQKNINCCIAIILPKKYQNIFGYKEFYDWNNVFIKEINQSYYYYANEEYIVLNSVIDNNSSVQKINQIVCEMKNGLPKFVGFFIENV